MNYETSVRADKSESFAASDYEIEGGARSKRWLWIALGIVGLIAAGLIVFAYVQQGEAAGAAAGNDEEQAPAISVITPGRTTVEGTITAPGTLAARRDLPVGVAGEGGLVIAVPVDAGDWVRKGQVLAVIDRSVQNQQVSSSAAQIEVARADARLAQANLDRALKLVERGFVSQADVDRLTATRDAANARVRVAQAQLGELRARNARLNVVAPASGLVLARSVERGQIVSAGSGALFRIAEGGEMELLAQLSETDLARVAPGVSASVVPVGTDKSFTGQIWQMAPLIDAQTRQGTARIALPYANELRPGGFATATIRSGTLVAPLLPESAILSDDKGSYVYIVGKDNKAVRRAVETGLVTRQGIAVVKGLTGNEQVVLRAGGFLTEGETMIPRKVQAGGN